MTGIVKWFDAKRGFGFISMRPADKLAYNIPEDADLWVHATRVIMGFPRKLKEGQRVSFEIIPGKNGQRKWQADEVMLIGEAPQTLEHVRD